MTDEKTLEQTAKLVGRTMADQRLRAVDMLSMPLAATRDHARGQLAAKPRTAVEVSRELRYAWPWPRETWRHAVGLIAGLVAYDTPSEEVRRKVVIHDQDEPGVVVFRLAGATPVQVSHAEAQVQMLCPLQWMMRVVAVAEEDAAEAPLTLEQTAELMGAEVKGPAVLSPPLAMLTGDDPDV